jgi:UDP-N-acetylmuramoyl-L-alanyl-D-glutamate--2,6-diaminopimelate ligase
MLKNPDGRFDVVQMNKIIGIVDYAHTPDALLNVLETISDIKNYENSIITVFDVVEEEIKKRDLKWEE